jgi:hypothetical protein
VLTPREKLDAAMRAPLGVALLRADSQMIDRPGWQEVVTPSAPDAMLNEVVWSQVDAGDVEGVFDEVVERRRAEGRAVKWCVGPWTRPIDMGERLARRGFAGWEVRGMVLRPRGRESRCVTRSRCAWRRGELTRCAL